MPAEIKEIELLLNRVLKKEKVKKEDTALIFEIWYQFLKVRGEGALSGDPRGWAAALYYILRNVTTGEGKSQTECADPFEISASTLSKRYQKIKKLIDFKQYQELVSKEKQSKKKRGKQKRNKKRKSTTGSNPAVKTEEKKIREKADKHRRDISPLPLTDNSLILIFKKMKELLELTHQDKDYFEIKKFLQFVDINLTMSGYRVNWPTLKEEFNRLFLKLDMIPVKGRDADKFIQLTDKRGKTEPYVYIQLRR